MRPPITKGKEKTGQCPVLCFVVPSPTTSKDHNGEKCMDDGEKKMIAAAHTDTKIMNSAPIPIRFSLARKLLCSYSYSSFMSRPLKKNCDQDTNSKHGIY